MAWKLQKHFKQGLSCCGCNFQTLTPEEESQGPVEKVGWLEPPSYVLGSR